MGKGRWEQGDPRRRLIVRAEGGGLGQAGQAALPPRGSWDFWVCCWGWEAVLVHGGVGGRQGPDGWGRQGERPRPKVGLRVWGQCQNPGLVGSWEWRSGRWQQPHSVRGPQRVPLRYGPPGIGQHVGPVPQASPAHGRAHSHPPDGLVLAQLVVVQHGQLHLDLLKWAGWKRRHEGEGRRHQEALSSHC